ncbi:N-acetylmuramoyl-L-alanine amidase [Sulfurivirga sp.]|uniref:N-acetylmuramoyl-L-alanine amidase n=1 Tax=Sulfurivirga sp. TaxID=2614236 RepID=UPI0025DD1496|nr:N-acetylmuramoyl-L-alanine amidase [Sulfurivirga sp.]
MTRKASIILAIMALWVGLSTVAQAAVQVASLRAGHHQDKVRLVLDIAGTPAYRIERLHNPERLLVRFTNAKAGLKYTRRAINLRWVRQVRTGWSGKHTYIVVFDLTRPVTYRHFALKGRRKGQQRLVIDVKPATTALARHHGSPKAATGKKKTQRQAVAARKPVKPAKVEQRPTRVARTATGKAPVQRSVKVARAVKKATPAPKATPKSTQTAHGGQRSKPVVSHKAATRVASTETARNPVKKAHERTRLQREIQRLTSRPLDDHTLIVAIDAGHGGKDTGAIGPGGILEKNVTLAMARALKRRIDREPGMRAVLIRDRDVFVPLYDRPKLARKYHADLFISIHADAFPHDPRVRGGSIYVLNRKGASSAMARALAHSENGSLFLSGGHPEKVSYVLGDLVRKANLRASRKLAHSVLQQMARRVKMHKLSVQSANFAVLRSLDMPSILIETAFISNPQDIRNLRSSSFHARMAEAITQGVKRFARKRSNKPHWGEPLYLTYRVKRGDTLSGIAHRFNVRLASLKRVNGIRNANRLYVGKRLRIPVTERMLAQL